METQTLIPRAALDQSIDAAIAERRLVGGYLAVSRNGELVYERAVGLADRESNAAFTPDTIVRLASVTKPIVSVAALRLIDESRLATPYVNDAPEPHLLADGEVVPNPFMPETAGVSFAPSRVFDHTSFPSGGGGMVGTGPETHRFLEAIRLDAHDGRRRLLRQETARSLFQGQIGALDTYPGMTFGFAGAVVRDPALAMTPQPAGTLNWGGVYGHKWFIDPVNAITATILTNTIYEGMNGQLTIGVRDALYPAGE